MYLETDILKSGNVLHNIPEKLPLKREKLIPLNLTDYQMKCGIWSQKLKSMSTGSTPLFSKILSFSMSIYRFHKSRLNDNILG
jgi:hypothetical protein